jgi:hypothetical protein
LVLAGSFFDAKAEIARCENCHQFILAFRAFMRSRDPAIQWQTPLGVSKAQLLDLGEAGDFFIWEAAALSNTRKYPIDNYPIG